MPLPESFYARDALDVARDLVGCEIAHGPVRLRITEVEAYRFPGDTANHARAGRTARNAPMWGPPGRSYIYLCYGLHQMLNLVTGRDGEAAAVLIRAAEPLHGLDVILARRAGRSGASHRGEPCPALLDGPGKVGQALGLATGMSGCALDGDLRVEPRASAPALLHGPRIGIGYAAPEDQAAPWRIAMAGTMWVGHRGGLRPAVSGGATVSAATPPSGAP